MNYILYDSSTRNHLLPLVFTRPVADIRIGILTIREKWELMLGAKTSTLTEGYLSSKYPIVEAEENLLINGSILPTPQLIDALHNLKVGQSLVKDNETLIGSCLSRESLHSAEATEDETIEFSGDITKVYYSWDIFSKNGKAITDDFALLTKGRKSAPISPTNRCVNPENIFIEEGAKVEFAILNASTGPIYIGRDAEVMEGAKVRGPFALCEHAVLKMDAKIYGPTTIGPYSKVGGEVNNAVIFGYSNKAHDGFLGNSVIGEWCNIGADTNTSNLKNSYEEVKLWNYAEECFVNTGLQFCGTIMGDHSKCGINTMFNTGTVVGVCANIFGSGFQRNFVPSFSWGGTQGFIDYELKKAFKTIERVYERRGKSFNQTERMILTEVFNQTFKNRRA
ncbi:MAG TPA: GlmU family protein [Bacteroidales bacterium]|nr:GlmU family protein [Bacteroidales bacterium]